MIKYKINKRIRRLLQCDDIIELKGDGKYIINHELKIYMGPYQKIDYTINRIFDVVKIQRKSTPASDFLFHPNTYISDDFVATYKHFNIKGEIIVPYTPENPPYKTRHEIQMVCNNCGIYAIVNSTLRISYIGETVTSFHKRWSQHYYKPTKSVKKLLKHKDTRFIILQITPPDKNITEALEDKYIKFYKSHTDYKILGGTFRRYLL